MTPERLRELRLRLKYGEHNFADIIDAWTALNEYAALLEARVPQEATGTQQKSGTVGDGATPANDLDPPPPGRSVPNSRADEFATVREIYYKAREIAALTETWVVKAQAPVEPGGALADVSAERERQQSVEGWTPAHDDEHRTADMARAGDIHGS